MVATTAKLFADPTEVRRRLERLDEPHIAPLSNFVRQLRRQRGGDDTVPWFDPDLAGVKARILVLHEAPGPRSVSVDELRSRGGSGIISPDNNDTTAANFSALTAEAEWSRDMYVSWNIVPWYIGDTRAIRQPTEADIIQALPTLGALLRLLPNLQVVLLSGRWAQKGWGMYLQRYTSDLVAVPGVHPSPRALNSRPDARVRALASMRIAKAVAEVAFAEQPSERSGAMVTEVEQEDWIKTRSWDLPTDLGALLNSLGVHGLSIATQQAAIRHLTTLPAWRSAPAQIKAAAEELLQRKP